MAQKKERRVARIFGALVAEKRKLLGVSQEALAEQVGISQESLSRMEKGHIAPRFERLQFFADALQCSIADLFREQGDTSERAATIEKIIAPLPDHAQKEIIEVVVKMAGLVGDNESVGKK